MTFTEEQKKRHWIGNAGNTQEEQFSRRRYSFVVAGFENIYKDKVVADFGCDYGTGIDHIMKVFDAKEGIGIDFQSQAIAQAIENYADENTTFFQGEIHDTRLDDNSIDVITCIEVIEHNDEAMVDSILKEMQRVLVDGGYVYFTTPELRGTKESFPKGSHYIEYTNQEFVEIVEKFNFKLVWRWTKEETKDTGFAVLFQKVGDEE